MTYPWAVPLKERWLGETFYYYYRLKFVEMLHSPAVNNRHGTVMSIVTVCLVTVFVTSFVFCDLLYIQDQVFYLKSSSSSSHHLLKCSFSQ
jgi:hypothetical protein